jgi:signal transduction histidine kinase
MTRGTRVPRGYNSRPLGAPSRSLVEHKDVLQIMSDANERDLFSRLVDLCADLQTETAIECAIWIDPAHVQLPTRVQDIVYRAVRELLDNVRRHSNATSVKITSWRRRDGSVAITVADNGVGLPSRDRRRGPVKHDAFGLWSIEHRLAELGGSLELESDHGTRATVVVPG